MYLSVALLCVVNTDARRCRIFEALSAILYPKSVFGRKYDTVLLSRDIHPLRKATGTARSLNSANQHCLGMPLVSANDIEKRVHSVAKINVRTSALPIHYLGSQCFALMRVARGVLFAVIRLGFSYPTA